MGKIGKAPGYSEDLKLPEYVWTAQSTDGRRGLLERAKVHLGRSFFHQAEYWFF